MAGRYFGWGQCAGQVKRELLEGWGASRVREHELCSQTEACPGPHSLALGQLTVSLKNLFLPRLCSQLREFSGALDRN